VSLALRAEPPFPPIRRDIGRSLSPKGSAAFASLTLLRTASISACKTFLTKNTKYQLEL